MFPFRSEKGGSLPQHRIKCSDVCTKVEQALASPPYSFEPQLIDKTFTLVERIVHLIIEKKVAPESLLVVTFTDKAARELTTRISNRLAELEISFNLNEMYLGTFHSICLRVLEEFREFTRLKRSFTLFDQFDQQYFLFQKIKEFRDLEDAQLVMGDDQTGRWSQSEQLMKWLNKVSEEALDPNVLEEAPDPEVRALARCFQRYQALLNEANCLDFSGIHRHSPSGMLADVKIA